jgi:hypothetical protein
VVYVAVPAWLAALLLGLYGDAHHWWENRAFLTNLLSSFTGLLLGVPFALVVLSHLGSMQADAANRRAAIRRGLEAARLFRATSLKGFAHSNPQQAMVDLIRLRTENAKLRQQLNTGLPPTDPQRRAYVRAVAQFFDARETAIQQAFSLSGEARQAWLDQVAQDWERLDRDVRPRLEEVGGQWMRPDAYTDLRKSGKQLANLSAVPMRKLRRTRQVFDPLEPGIPSPPTSQFEKSIATLRRDADATHEVVVALLEIMRNLSDVERIAT